MFCTQYIQYNLILQASVCPLVCVPEECTLRGEVRREEEADLLAPVIQTLVLQQQLMAASLARARARSGGGEGWNVQNFYILLDEEERM